MENNAQPRAAAGNEQKKAREIPDVILRLLSRPPLLPTESVPEFLELFESFASAISPQNVLDYHLVYDIAVLTFEVIRYRRLRIAILKHTELIVVEFFSAKPTTVRLGGRVQGGSYRSIAKGPQI